MGMATIPDSARTVSTRVTVTVSCVATVWVTVSVRYMVTVSTRDAGASFEIGMRLVDVRRVVSLWANAVLAMQSAPQSAPATYGEMRGFISVLQIGEARLAPVARRSVEHACGDSLCSPPRLLVGRSPRQ